MIDIKKVIANMTSELAQKKRELWWALHENDMEAFDRIGAEIDELEKKEAEDGSCKNFSESPKG